MQSAAESGLTIRCIAGQKTPMTWIISTHCRKAASHPLHWDPTPFEPCGMMTPPNARVTGPSRRIHLHRHGQMAQFLRGEDLQTVVYWDDDLRYQKAKYSKPAESAKFIDVASGFVSCRVQTDGSLYCWGWAHRDLFKEPSGSFTMVGRVGDSACAIRTDGTVAFWSKLQNKPVEPPEWNFVSIEHGSGSHYCGIQTDGSVACWGSITTQGSPPPAGSFTEVSIGTSTT